MPAFLPFRRPLIGRAFLVLLAACGGTAPPSEPPPVAQVAIDPGSATLPVGNQVQLTATLTDADGHTLTGRTIAWSSSDPSVATVTGEGAVVGVAPGTVTITATAESQSGTAEITVGPAAVATIALGPSAPSGVAGEAVQLSVTVRDAAGHVLTDRAVSWSSSAPDKATVDGAGLVTGVSAGVTTIQAQSEARTGTVSFTVAEGGLVGPSGGTVTGFAGTVMLDVPAGALAAPAALRLSRTTSVPLDASAAAGSEIILGPSSLTFALPATITLAYQPPTAPQGVAEDALGIRKLQGASWVPVAAQVANPSPLLVSGEVGAAGAFGVGRLPSATSCPGAQAHQFDFWLGDWDVFNTVPPAGNGARSHITTEAGGCALFEDFTDPLSGYHGVSVNVFDPVDQQWHQTYVDTDHARLLFAGTLVGADMILTMPDQSSRIVWSPLSGGRVRQVGQASSDGGQTFPTVQFDLTYVPH